MMTISPAGFRNDIQGIRAIAVALVVVHHAGVVTPGGFIGVDVFFVVSGFVITRMLLKEFDAQGKINFRNFYLRRIRRLLLGCDNWKMPMWSRHL
ncbi:MAG: acyltransferase [Ilumatobacteraceae bacterium]|jgi:peptidoglycan/LPS O-acetylase OafA/YrhL|nr:acyltransferase [Ilumatobacteraceae bacterium]MDP4702372.1 acyltransferase [Ilumatobacteraceae bacterium]MDP4930267.1 acyltransferase [Ilumatobacteraceae bacterium]